MHYNDFHIESTLHEILTTADPARPLKKYITMPSSSPVQVTIRLWDNLFHSVGQLSTTYETFIKCCGRMRLPEDVARTSVVDAIHR